MIPQRITIMRIQDRRVRGTNRPWIARWTVDGREHSRSFETEALANDFTASLRAAVRQGHMFDGRTGMPSAWLASREPLVDFAVNYVRVQARTWARATVDTVVEGIARGILLSAPTSAPEPPPATRDQLRRLLKGTSSVLDPDVEVWLTRWVPDLAGLDAVTVRRIHAGLGLNDSGTVLAAATANRFRKDFHQMYDEAVRLEKLPKSHWPRPRRKKRRSEMIHNEIDVESLPSAETTAKIIDGLISHQPGSNGYWILSMVSWVIGTRPSEARALRVEDFDLPITGPGAVRIRRSIDRQGFSGETKTGKGRTVQVPEFLVAHLRSYIGDRTEGLLVSTRSGRPVGLSNWLRALQRSCATLGVPRISPYDFRHSCASLLLADGLPPATIARRLGNSVDALLRYYASAITGHEELVNAAAERLFSGLAHQPIARA
jgi:integrase